jgi:DNA-binding phage protein
MSRSWSLQAVARAAGLRAPQLARALENPRTITPKLANEVSAAYDRLWNGEPPRETREQRELADAAANVARKGGWAPPLAWDDDQIDRPDGQPVPDWRRSARVTMRSADLSEDADFVRAMGGYADADVGIVAARLGVSRARLEKALSRQRTAVARGEELEPG